MTVRHLKTGTPLSPFAVYEVDGKIIVHEKGKKPRVSRKATEAWQKLQKEEGRS